MVMEIKNKGEENEIDPAVEKAAHELQDAYSLARVSPDKAKAKKLVLDSLDRAVVTTEAVEQRKKLKVSKPSHN